MYVGLVPTGSPATWDVVTGTLVIVFFDNKTDRGCFSRIGQGCVAARTKRLPAADAKMVAKRVNNAITKIFKKYPKA